MSGAGGGWRSCPGPVTRLFHQAFNDELLDRPHPASDRRASAPDRAADARRNHQVGVRSRCTCATISARTPPPLDPAN